MKEKTYIPKLGEIERRWFVVDAEGKVLGRLATRIAQIVRGKEKPYFTPHLDTGDFVVVVNADKIRVTGKKPEAKIYYRHSGYVGHLREEPLERLLARKPEWVILHAVRGMLPKNRLGRKLLRKVKVYRGPTHPHAAQNPQPLEVE
ncbi:MAG: 50S ribosomal protein L13 [Candidatus Coatesbacteria bacterium]|nr:MAG: 50S ribosomal protein L13 [Candidatus Coatesbacteria bacterium]